MEGLRLLTLLYKDRNAPSLLCIASHAMLHSTPPLPPPPPYPLAEVFPYISAEWETIMKGWVCAAATVYCLSAR